MRKFNITVNGKTYEVDVEEIGGAPAAAPAPVQAAAPAAAPKAAPAPAAPKAAPVAGAKQVKSPMPGTIVSVKVNVGDKVSKDTLVAVLEAMKMENEILAPKDGKVSSVGVAKGASVQTGTLLCTID